MSNDDETSEDPSYAAQVLPLVREAGAAWVAEWRAALEKDGRPLVGGWPGTVAEARAVVLGRIVPMLARKGMTPALRDRMARDLYTTARKAWLSTAAPEV